MNQSEAMKALNDLIEELVGTLEPQNKDSADFHELAVWQVEALIKAAYTAGHTAGYDRGVEHAQADSEKTYKRGHRAGYIKGQANQVREGGEV